MNKILVTGSNGFTGSAVVKSLIARGYDVTAMILPGSNEENLKDIEVKRIYGNLLDRNFLLESLKNIDAIHHVAAIFDFAADPTRDPLKYARDCDLFYRNNLEGTTSLMLAAISSRWIVLRVVVLNRL